MVNDLAVSAPVSDGQALASFVGESMVSSLRFAKGDFIGADKNTVPLGTKYLAIVLEARRGIVRWGASGITDSHVGLIREHFLTPHRESLGDDDESKWSL